MLAGRLVSAKFGNSELLYSSLRKDDKKSSDKFYDDVDGQSKFDSS